MICFAALAAMLTLGAMMASASRAGVTLTFDATLNGPSESPANASPGFGNATVDLVNTMHLHVDFVGLMSLRWV
jgi:hypothetical protein